MPHEYMHHASMHHIYMYTSGFMHQSYMDISAWVTQPERPKGAKYEVKEAGRAAD